MVTKRALISAKKIINTENKWCSKGWGVGKKKCIIHALMDAFELKSAASTTETEAYRLLCEVAAHVVIQLKSYILSTR